MKLADEHGPVLTGRGAAASIVDRVVVDVAAGESVVLDFDGVDAVSPSFADELFGMLATRVNDAENRVVFTNLSEHLESVARMARSRRAADGAR